MHKIFAKPLFLGKKVIFLTECHSTNEELAKLLKAEKPLEGTIVHTNHQKSGKGQRGNVWIDEPGKNLLISILLKPGFLPVSSQHLLNVAVGLGVLRCASRYLDESLLQLKWPNDLLVSCRKIAGILIENTIKGTVLDTSIVGIGFNLNQQSFGLLNATSVFLESNKEVDRLDFIEQLLLDLEFYLLSLKNGNYQSVLSQYHEKLYLRGEIAPYEDKYGVFSGTISGIDASGNLVVERQEGTKTYGLKELKFLS